MPAALSARNLACRRGDRVLFTGLDCTLAESDVLHVTGANGTGKSSLIRILAGLLPAFGGTVERSGTMAMLDERLALDSELPLGRALGFWHALDRAGEDAFEELGLVPLLDVPVRYLSTGQRKRAGFARLLGQRAAIWLLDEPFNGLDRVARDTMLHRFEAHREAGGITIIASHTPVGMEAATLDIESYSIDLPHGAAQ